MSTAAVYLPPLHERILAALDAEVAELATPAWLPSIARRVGEPEHAVKAAINELARAGIVRWVHAGMWGMADVVRVRPAWRTPGTVDWRIVAAVDSVQRRTGWGASYDSITFRTCLFDPNLLRARLSDLVADGVLLQVGGGWRLAREH